MDIKNVTNNYDPGSVILYYLLPSLKKKSQIKRLKLALVFFQFLRHAAWEGLSCPFCLGSHKTVNLGVQVCIIIWSLNWGRMCFQAHSDC